METDKLTTDSRTNKKSKAVGAFRVFLNFLHKTNKRGNYDSHTNENSASDKLATVNCSDKDMETVCLPKQVGEKNVNVSHSPSYSDPEPGTKTILSTNNKPEIKDKDSTVPLSWTSSGKNEIMTNVDVVLNDSYFEDDYIEDFSVTSSEGGSDAYRCCDIPQPLFDHDPLFDEGPLFDDVFDGCADIFCAYNNLNAVATVHKDYNDKIIPNFTNPTSECYKSKPEVSGGHRRRHSMPCETLAMMSTQYSDDVKDVVSNVKRLHSCVECAAQPQPNTDSNQYLQESSHDVNSMVANCSDKSPPSGCSSPESNFNTPAPCNVSDSSELSVSKAGETKSDPVFVLDMGRFANTNGTFDTKGSECGRESRLPSIDGFVSSSPPTDLGRGDHPQATPELVNNGITPTTDVHSTLCLLDEWKDQDGRRSSQDSVESGYATSSHRASTSPYRASTSSHRASTSSHRASTSSHRASTSSHRSSPVESNPTPPLSDVDGETRDSAFQQHSSYRATTPPLTNHETPLYKLHSGIPLSPDSRNAIDGIIANNKQNKLPTPKRIFTQTASNSVVPNSDLTPVLENGANSATKRESIKIESDDRCGDAASKINTPEIKTTADCPSSSSLPMFQHTETQEASRPNTVDINLSISVSIVDMNQNATSSTALHENVHVINSLSSFPPSPTRNGTAAPPPPPSMALKDEVQTPIHQIATMEDALDRNVISCTSPFGQTLRPICTSSPLPNKFAPTSRQISHTAPPVALERLPASITRIDGGRSASPTKGGHEKVKMRGLARRSHSDKRKRFVKRKSARARLTFGLGLSSLNESYMKNGTDKNPSAFQYAASGDYVMLKRIAESIVLRCPNREFIYSWVDLPALMENLHGHYDRLMKWEGFKSKKILCISHLREEITRSRNDLLSNLSIDTCLKVVFMSFLIHDSDRIAAGLDFVFENLPRVFEKHSNLSDMAPEVVMLLLSNQRTIVNNHHGFPLPYAQSEKEVLKAVGKYVQSIPADETMKPFVVTRVKNLLSVVADPCVLTKGSSDTPSSLDKILLKESSQPPRMRTDSDSQLRLVVGRDSNCNSGRLPAKKPPPPRSRHSMLFTRTGTTHSNNRNTTANEYHEYLFQPFISSSIHSLDEIDFAAAAAAAGIETAPPIPMSDITNDRYVLRKLYFSYRRCNISGLPFITKIGMQYSHRGKKKTVFIAQASLKNATKPNSSGLKYTNNKSIVDGGSRVVNKPAMVASTTGAGAVSKDDQPQACAGIDRSSYTPTPTTTTILGITGSHPRQDPGVKKAAVILKAGEHVTAISVLGERALHNIEIVTNTGRRIRAHNLQDAPPGARWVAMATPNDVTPFCLHALYGDVFTSSAGRSYIRDLGALWVSTSSSGGNDFG